MIVVGLTGSLATGKTTVARMLARKGAIVLNADTMAHELIDIKGRCHRKVKKLLGPSIFSNGRIDRKKMAHIVFNDQEKLTKLVKIIHPAVRKEIKERISYLKKKQNNKIVVLDVPLLFESNIDRDVDWAIVVKSSRKQQIQRAIKRSGLTRREVLNRIQSQMPLSEKVRLSDIIIDNGKTLQQTQKQVNNIWQKLSRKIKK